MCRIDIWTIKGLEVSLHYILENLLLQRQLCHQPLEFRVLPLPFFQPFRLVQLEAAVFLSPAVIRWADVLGKVYKRHVLIYVFANNHYAGFGPATVEMFRDLWRKQRIGDYGDPPTGRARPVVQIIQDVPHSHCIDSGLLDPLRVSIKRDTFLSLSSSSDILGIYR
jgi:hypothetical protein